MIERFFSAIGWWLIVVTAISGRPHRLPQGGQPWLESMKVSERSIPRASKYRPRLGRALGL